MGMGTAGNTPNPGEREDRVELAREQNVKPKEAPKGEMYPQDGVDRSLDHARLREEARRQWPLDQANEVRDEEADKKE